LSLPGGEWVVDCFEGGNAPLVLAEVELSDVSDAFDLPMWCGQEVTGEGFWSNAALAHQPVSSWSLEKRQRHGLARN